MRPLVTVIIPAFNSAKTLPGALASVEAQDYEALETIVVDDCSTDGTSDVAAAAGAVKVIRLDANRGVSVARNAGIQAAQGEFIAFLDADDLWLPGKLAKQAAILEKNPRVTLVTCDTRLVNLISGATRRSHAIHPPAEGPDAWKALLIANFIPTPTVMARRRDLIALGGFAPELRFAEDLDLWIRLACLGELAVAPEILVEVHERPDGLSSRYVASEMEILLPIIERHLKLQKDRLSSREARAVRGARYFQMGAHLYARGMYSKSVAPFFRSALLGVRPFKSLANIPRALLMSVLPGRRQLLDENRCGK